MKSKFHYKAWANAEMLDTVAQIDEEQYPEEREHAVRLMNHTYVVDRIFAAHLCAKEHQFQGTNTPETPTIDQLRKNIFESDSWYQQYVSELGEEKFRESISFTFTDGDRGTMTREEMLFHILAHGAYHRGNVGMILSSCGIERPKDTFTRFLHLTEESCREQI
ncbi:DinB family protein [Halomonas sp. SpR1]|uniref:DinB family protein n=1 Tax=Halomonas sp. SpR1 TaxID=3050462 RepID=UPI0027E3ECF5|nr:DinB family protein [Halomonas sp. SpR1]MDQ7733655.1 DinB family protein [Halomonas sp. SpR1]